MSSKGKVCNRKQLLLLCWTNPQTELGMTDSRRAQPANTEPNSFPTINNKSNLNAVGNASLEARTKLRALVGG